MSEGRTPTGASREVGTTKVEGESGPVYHHLDHVFRGQRRGLVLAMGERPHPNRWVVAHHLDQPTHRLAIELGLVSLEIEHDSERRPAPRHLGHTIRPA